MLTETAFTNISFYFYFLQETLKILQTPNVFYFIYKNKCIIRVLSHFCYLTTFNNTPYYTRYMDIEFFLAVFRSWTYVVTFYEVYAAHNDDWQLIFTENIICFVHYMLYWELFSISHVQGYYFYLFKSSHNYISNRQTRS